MHYFWTKMPIRNKLIHGYISSHHLFFFFFFLWMLSASSSFLSFFLSFFLFFFLLIYWAGLSNIFFLSFVFFSFSFSFFFCLDVIFFYGHDFYFLINLGDWFFLLVYHFFGFNWTSFFNKGIHVNLYKLIFPSLHFFIPNQTKRREIKIFSIIPLFHFLTIFYLLNFSPI